MRQAYSHLLNFGSRSRTPMIHQTEAAECGLACVAMVAAHHGREIELSVLRRRYPLSIKGVTLADLTRIAESLQLIPRSLRLEPDSLQSLRLPVVLHWDMSHFVVLVAIRGDRFVVHDPGKGRRVYSQSQMERHFTGVALELTPATDFSREVVRDRMRISELWGNHKGILKVGGQILVASFGLQVLALASPWFMQLVVDKVLLSADLDLLSVLAIGFAMLAIIQVAVTAFRTWMIVFLSAHLGFEMVGNLMSHLMRLPSSFFMKGHIGDLVSRFGSVESIQRTLTTSFIEAIVDGLMVMVTLAVMLVYSVKLTFVVLAALAIYISIRLVIFRPWRQAIEETLVSRARKDSVFLETMRGIQSLRVANQETPRLGLFMNQLAEEKNAEVRTARWKMWAKASNNLLFGLEIIVVIWLGALLVIEGSLSIGMLLAFVAYRTSFTGKVSSLIDKFLEYRMLGLHLERVADIARREPETDLGTGESDNAPINGAIELRDVSFRYSMNEPFVLKNVSFRVEPGESVAIAGQSGCGKTTLLKLMLGLLKPVSGSILVDGVPIDDRGVREYRSQVAAVMQDDGLFAGTITDNITFFDTHPDLKLMRKCAADASIEEEILAMPMRYETLVGDMGSGLSGGQRQRILLARALYRQPRMIFLDEATSNMDMARERFINDSIKRLEITRIIVAHRKETLESVNRVLDLDEIKEAAERCVALSETVRGEISHQVS